MSNPIVRLTPSAIATEYSVAGFASPTRSRTGTVVARMTKPLAEDEVELGLELRTTPDRLLKPPAVDSKETHQ